MEGRRSRGWIINLICIISILGVFAVSGLMLVNVGVRVYKDISLSNLENFKLRTSLSFVETRLRQSDIKGGISLGDKDGVPVLILDETADGIEYETLIYFCKGILYEIYQEKGLEYGLNDGQEITAIAGFHMEMEEQGLLRCTAVNEDGMEESLYYHIRTGQTGQAATGGKTG